LHCEGRDVVGIKGADIKIQLQRKRDLKRDRCGIVGGEGERIGNGEKFRGDDGYFF